MKELLQYYRLTFLPEMLEDALKEVPRNDKKVTYLRQQVFNLKKQYDAEHTTN
jgi:hypothetical protein